MKIPTKIEAAFVVNDDERGFLNAFNYESLIHKLGISSFSFVYQLLSFSENAGTFRGMHFQTAPFEQNKLLIIHSGQIRDFLISVKSPKATDVFEFDLIAGDALFIPKSFAHGFLTVTDNVLMQYLMDNDYSPNHYSGYFGLDLVAKYVSPENCLVSQKDINLPRLIQ